MISKKKSISVHANRRCKQRFGFRLGKKGQRELVSLIQKNKATFVKRQSLRVTVWDVVFKNKPMRLVYCTATKKIATVLYQPAGL